MLRILLSAYACEPDRGSEPGVGWEWATRLAESHEVFVLTRANNRSVIERKIAQSRSNRTPHFIYYDLPRPLLFLKQHKLLPVFAYYLLWQLGARTRAARHFSKIDIIHHVTFNGFRFPGAWWCVPLPVVLGPLGGASVTANSFKRCFGKRWFLESIRSWTVRSWQSNPWTVASLRNATKVLAVGEEMAEKLIHEGVESESMLETALPLPLEMARPPIPIHERIDFVLVGNLEPWKAWQIALEAFSQAIDLTTTPPRLKVIGTGTQMDEARKLARDLGISELVDFLGQLPREETWKIVERSRGLLFPSVRDTSGNVVLEAMGLAVPVICFFHQGVGFITDDNCALRIRPDDWANGVQGFRHAIQQLQDSDELVTRMGHAGRRRVLELFTWESKIKRMSAIYQSIA